MIRLLLADDHEIVRQGLSALLTNQKDIKIIAETSDGISTLNKAESLKPDVIILDLELPDLSGLEVLRQIKQRNPNIRIVVLSMYAKEAYVAESFKYGAIGYVLKGSDASEIILAIRNAMQNSRYLSPPFTELAIETYLKNTTEETIDLYDTLTNRERQVLSLAAKGLSSSDIAQQLNISPRTVESHRAKFMHKLNLSNHTDLIRFALRKGLIPLEE
jgi:two-component system, NarL family, response regulator NreC